MALAAWPVEASGSHADGRVGLFGEHVAIVTSSVCARLHVLDGPFVFGGPVMAAAPDVEGGYLLFVHEPTAGTNEQLRIRLGPDLLERERGASPLRASTARWLESSRAHLIAGHIEGGGSGVPIPWLCPPGMAAGCVDLSNAGGETRGVSTSPFGPSASSMDSCAYAKGCPLGGERYRIRRR